MSFATPHGMLTTVIGMKASFSGVSKSTDADGYYTYTRPEGKQGGHGVGWSELPQYAFKIPPGWSEKAVSIADLGGTEVQNLCLVLFASAVYCCSRHLPLEALSTVLSHLRSQQYFSCSSEAAVAHVEHRAAALLPSCNDAAD